MYVPFVRQLLEPHLESLPFDSRPFFNKLQMLSIFLSIDTYSAYWFTVIATFRLCLVTHNETKPAIRHLHDHCHLSVIEVKLKMYLQLYLCTWFSFKAVIHL